jgi:DNA-binding CsgD family transcriptional regulator/PAS domain-containing protein
VVAVARTGICPGVPLETFSKVVESIYDCALDVSGWPETIGMIVELCRSINGILVVYDLKNRGGELTYHARVEEHYQQLHNVYTPMNPHPVPLQLVPVGRVVTSGMLVDKHEFVESRFYREFLKPQGIRDLIGFNVLKTGQRIGAFSVHRGKSYGEAEVRLLTLLAPHVCRSVTISDALNLKTVKSEALEGALDALASGVYLTDRESRIVYMNRAAEHQVKTGNALRIQNNRLVPMDRAARAALARAIDEASVDEVEMPDSGFTLALPEGEKAGLVATVLPLNRGERRHLGGAATAAIFVQDPVVVPPFPGEAFAKLYDLTGSELRVLLAMAPGLSIKEAAEMLGISDNTAKTHLQHIYSKTGTSKQTELMHLFMSSTPPVRTA